MMILVSDRPKKYFLLGKKKSGNIKKSSKKFLWKNEKKALSAVIPGAHNFNAIPKEFSIVDPEDVLRENGFKKIKIEDTKIAFDENENGIGYVMRINSSIGYSGDIIFLLGYRFDGTTTGIEFLAVSEFHLRSKLHFERMFETSPSLCCADRCGHLSLRRQCR